MTSAAVTRNQISQLGTTPFTKEETEAQGLGGGGQGAPPHWCCTPPPEGWMGAPALSSGEWKTQTPAEVHGRPTESHGEGTLSPAGM